MKVIALLAAIVFAVFSANAMDIKKAVASNLVTVRAFGTNYDSLPPDLRKKDFRPKMEMLVTNVSNNPVEVELQPGDMLQSAEAGYQAMLVVQPVIVALKPKQTQHSYVYAMCTQLQNSGPNSLLHYTVAGKARPELLQMALFIADKKYLSHAAQEAVWSISNNTEVMYIADSDTTMSNNLQREAAKIKGQNYEKLKKEYASVLASGRGIPFEGGDKIDRNIPFKTDTSTMVSAGYYDMAGNEMHPIFSNALLKEGKHSIRYNPYPVGYAGKRYSVRLYKDGSLYREYYYRQL